MPFREPAPAEFNAYLGAAPPEAQAPSWATTFGAAFRLENDVFALADLATRKQYEDDPNFNLKEWLEKNDLWDYRDNFLGQGGSEAEAQSVAQRIKQEEEDRDTLHQAGWAGLVAGVGAGVLSPTMFIPLMAGGRGLAAFGRAGAMALGASAAQELPLQAAQETRTAGESALAIGAGTVLGGILGGTAATLTAKELGELTAKFEAGMANKDYVVTIPTSAVGAASARAADAGKFSSSLGLVELMRKLSPVLRTVEQDVSPQGRWMMTQMSDAGLTFEKAAAGVPSTPLGTAENLIKTWYGRFAQGVEALDENYAAFVYDGAAPTFARNQRAAAVGFLRGGEKSKASFREAVARAMREGDVSPNKYVEATAKAFREKIYNPILEEAQARGILPGELKGALGDFSYLFRDYNRDVISAHYAEFVDILSRHYEGKLTEDFMKKASNFQKAMGRDEELIDVIKMGDEEVEEANIFYTELLEENKKAMEEGTFNALEESISTLRAQAKELKGTGLENELARRQLLADAREMEKSGGEGFQKLRAERADLRRRLRNLNKAQVVLERRTAAKLRKAEIAEENSLTTLERLVSKVTKVMDKLDGLSDEAFDAQISGLKDDFERVAKQYDRGEERIHSLLNKEAEARSIISSGQKGVDDPRFKGLTTARQAATEIANNSKNPSYKAIANRILPLIDDVAFKVVDIGEQVPTYAANRLQSSYGIHVLSQNLKEGTLVSEVFVRGSSFGARTGQNEEVILHELLHAAAGIQLQRARKAAISPRATDFSFKPDLSVPGAKAYIELNDLANKVREALNKKVGIFDETGEEAAAISRALINPEELITYGLTNPYVQGVMKEIKVGNKSLWGVFVSALGKLLGIKSSDNTALGKLLEISQEVFNINKEEAANFFRGTKTSQSAEGQLFVEGERQLTRADKLSAIAQQLEDAENLDRADIRALLQDGIDEAFSKAQSIVERRAVRNARLREQAAAMRPEEVSARVARIKEDRSSRQRLAEDKLRTQGADYVDLSNGKADFSRVAKEAARETANKIRGVHLRLPAFEIMQGERGAELARVLDIPSNLIEKFLENDIERLTRSYLRTMAPDIEIARKFGSVNGEEAFSALVEEESKKLEEVGKVFNEKRVEKGLAPLEGEELSAATAKESKRISDSYEDIRRDLTAVMGRLRHTWGLPSDPDGFAWRAGRVAMNLNVLRMMGGVAVSSIPDVARPIMKYGLTKTFRNGVMPLIQNTKALKLSRKELRLAGGALDVILHSRSQAMFDIMDDLGRGSKFERGLEFATNKMGIVALFDYWTAAMKQFSGAIANVEILDSIKTVVEGTGNVPKATQYLASLGIDGERARDIWGEVLQGGGRKVNGVWLSDTELWKNSENVLAFRSALVREVDNAIVTPGVERPLWVDSSLLGRLLGQFKSFAMSSTTKTLMSGAQQRDMAFLNGALISLAFGALSYYIWARLAGGDSEKEMLEADIGKWADEMIDRSGLPGILSEGQRIAERIPAVSPYANFSGERSTRRGGSSLIEALFGPSFDLAVDTGKVVTELDDPTQSTLHTLRTMAPLQNHLFLRRALNSVEQGAGDALGLPERRQ